MYGNPDAPGNKVNYCLFFNGLFIAHNALARAAMYRYATSMYVYQAPEHTK
jgi:hypothetical protein